MKDLNSLTKDNKFLMLALDHRGSFQKLLNSALLASNAALQGDVPSGTSQGLALQKEVEEAKYQIIEALYDQFSGVLLDPQFGLPAYQKYVQSKNIEHPKPYLLSIEKTGYTEENGERVTELEYTVSQLQGMGASGVKILLYFNPKGNSSQKQLEAAKKVLEDCRVHNMLLFLEIVTYSSSEQSESRSNNLTIQQFNNNSSRQARTIDQKADLITKSVQAFIEAGVSADVFKLEYPGDENSCKTTTQILGQTPWILLTRGGDFTTFKKDLAIAVQNGATGFLAGRSIWQEFTKYQGDARKKFLEETARGRFEEIVTIAIGK